MCVGYLKEEGCIASYRTFLKEMKHLEEYRTLMAAGFEYPTSICGKNLKTMLNEYADMILAGNCHIILTIISVTLTCLLHNITI